MIPISVIVTSLFAAIAVLFPEEDVAMISALALTTDIGAQDMQLHRLTVMVCLVLWGVTRPCAWARQAKRVLTQGRTGASRDKSLKMT